MRRAHTRRFPHGAPCFRAGAPSIALATRPQIHAAASRADLAAELRCTQANFRYGRMTPAAAQRRPPPAATRAPRSAASDPHTHRAAYPTPTPHPPPAPVVHSPSISAAAIRLSLRLSRLLELRCSSLHGCVTVSFFSPCPHGVPPRPSCDDRSDTVASHISSTYPYGTDARLPPDICFYPSPALVAPIPDFHSCSR